MGKIVPVILAAISGVVAGVLLAPKSGKETRQDLQNKKAEYKVKAEDSLKTIKKGASSIKDELKAGGNNLKNIAEEVGDDVKVGARRISSEVRGRAESVKENVDATAESVKRSAR